MGSNATNDVYNFGDQKTKFFLDNSDQLEYQPRNELAPCNSNPQDHIGEERVFYDDQTTATPDANAGEKAENEFAYLNKPLESLIWEVLAPYLSELKPGKGGSSNSRIYDRIAEDFDHKFPGRCRDVRKCITREFYYMRLRAHEAAATGRLSEMYQQIVDWYNQRPFQTSAMGSKARSSATKSSKRYNPVMVGYKLRKFKRRKRVPSKETSTDTSSEVPTQPFSSLAVNFDTLRRREREIAAWERSAEQEPLRSFGRELNTLENMNLPPSLERQRGEEEVREEMVESQPVENSVHHEIQGHNESREIGTESNPTQETHPEVGGLEQRPQNCPKIADVLRTIHFCRTHGFTFELSNGHIILKTGPITEEYVIPFGQMQWDT
ncbi:unnamed protein product [Bursaphelenchus xylophilus]|nr:unnamed protein product [Bursaphelenchus xylophilus]CAG9118757.1 unnamed protein product [Bursaphelenchus xylophilus]